MFLVRPKFLPAAKKRVFCFTHAGGSASAFVPWASALAPEIEVFGVQLPGRGHRMGEAMLGSVEDLVDEIAIDVEGLIDRPYLFFGHSMGSLLAFEITRLFRREGLVLPRRLIVSAFVAPQHAQYSSSIGGRNIHELGEEELIAFLRRLGSAASQTALDDPEIRSLMLPVVRADFSLLAAYQMFAEEPLETPITAVAGERDPLATPALMEGWRDHTRDFTMVRRDRGHFLIEEDAAFLLDLLRAA
jgi:surfactin synthase thioesterase subunit